MSPTFSLPGSRVCVPNRRVSFSVLPGSRTFSENDCTMVAPAEPCLSPTKGEFVYSKTAKQCLEEISGMRLGVRAFHAIMVVSEQYADF